MKSIEQKIKEMAKESKEQLSDFEVLSHQEIDYLRRKMMRLYSLYKQATEEAKEELLEEIEDLKGKPERQIYLELDRREKEKMETPAINFLEQLIENFELEPVEVQGFGAEGENE